MTVLYDAQLPQGQAQTHALVIGVADYPHLPGGSRFNNEPAPRDFGLQALTSPLVSASALVEWLLTRHDNPAAPLGSVELLLSPGSFVPAAAAAAKIAAAAGAPVDVEVPTLAALKVAAGRWFVRANRLRSNIALVYFCGHGLEASDRYLLPADFGSNPLDWTDNIVNLSATYNNMERCRAKTQCFFLDACRDRPQELRAQAAAGPVGQALIGPQPGNPLERDAIIFHAAAPGQSAAGPPGQTSYFTRALIDCLDGLGAGQLDGARAPVTHVSLGSALRELVERVAEENGLSLRCAVGGDALLAQPADLHLIPTPVKVLATVECDPAAAHQVAVLAFEDRAGTRVQRPAPGEKPWKLTVTAGTYTLQATFAAGRQFRSFTREEIVTPPVFRARPPIESL